MVIYEFLPPLSYDYDHCVLDAIRLQCLKKSSSLHSTVLAGFSKPYFALTSYDLQEHLFKILEFMTSRFF